MEHDGLWSLDREGGIECVWCCLGASLRNLARFGMPYRDRGFWRGAALIPAGWVEASRAAGGCSAQEWQRSEVAPVFRSYGYQWWLLDRGRGDFAAIGKNGQILHVDPANDAVVVRLGRSEGCHRDVAPSTADWLALRRAVSDRLAGPHSVRPGSGRCIGGGNRPMKGLRRPGRRATGAKSRRCSG